MRCGRSVRRVPDVPAAAGAARTRHSFLGPTENYPNGFIPVRSSGTMSNLHRPADNWLEAIKDFALTLGLAQIFPSEARP